jgi:hypothetical protein
MFFVLKSLCDEIYMQWTTILRDMATTAEAIFFPNNVMLIQLNTFFCFIRYG